MAHFHTQSSHLCKSSLIKTACFYRNGVRIT